MAEDRQEIDISSGGTGGDAAEESKQRTDTELLHDEPVSASADEDFDEFQEADDRGGYFEFVNPRAIEAAFEDVDYTTFDENEALPSDQGEGALPLHADPGHIQATGGETVETIRYTMAAVGLSTIPEGSDEDQATGLPQADTEGRAKAEGTTESAATAASGAGDNTATTEEEAEGDSDFEGDDVARNMTAEQVEQLVMMRLRQLDKEYHEANPSTVIPGLSDPDPKVRKLAELRARLAAAKAAAASQATMELAPGADEFPDDYDALQQEDSVALRTQPSGVVMVTSAEEIAITVKPAKRKQRAAAATEPFDPFGTDKGKKAQKAPARTQESIRVRPVSPLRDDTKATIKDVMSRIKIVPKYPVTQWTEKVVQAALETGRRSVAAHVAATSTTESSAATSQ